MDFAQPPPVMGGPNIHMPPPNMPPPNINMPPPNMGPPGYTNNRPPFRPFLNLNRPLPGPLGNMTLEDFDGKRLRKSVMRKTVDYNSAIIKELENRVWQRDYRDRRALQPDVMYYPDMMPPPSYPDNPINCVTTRFVKTATNKMRCPIFCMAWTPEGRRLVTGASSGEFTLWNGLTFNFETILQAHDSPVRTMVWSHNDSWMVTGDHAGYVKYWQSNMNNVKMFQAHKEALRGISFSPSDSKFVTCSDDGTLRIWDFFRYQEERILRGHGADVKCVHWHPQKGLIISGSKDNQQPIKLWDPKTGQSLATLHAHKSTVMDLKWNENGNWLITASRDHLLKLFDLRNLSQEVQTFRGHKKEASSVAWHPHHEGLFCSGGSDGSIMFWHVGADKEVGAIEQAHDSIVWTLAWHPLGHILCSGSNDHTSKFWTRNRPGDLMRDKYNLNILPAGITGLEDIDMDEPSVIPGMGPEDKVEFTSITLDENMAIPGLDLDMLSNADDKSKAKKVPYSKPIPRNFQAQWNETGDDESAINEVISQIVENTPGVVPLEKIAPNAIIVYGKLIPVQPGSKLEAAISEGPEALKKFIDSGQIEELHDVMPHDDEHDYLNDAYLDEDEEEAEKGKKNSSDIPKNSGRNKSGFSDHHMDQDMRSKQSFGSMSGDVDMRGSGGDMDMRHGEMDYRNSSDFEMRGPNMRGMGGNHDMRSRGIRGQDLRNQDVRGQDIRGQDIRSQDIRGQDMRSHDIRGQDRGQDMRGQGPRSQGMRGQGLFSQGLNSPDLKGDDVRGMRNQDIHNQDLRSLSMRGHSLRGRDLGNRNMSGLEMRSPDLAGSDSLDMRTAGNANLRNTDSRSSDVRNPDLRKSDLRNADLRTVDLRTGELRNANVRSFEDQDMPDEDFDGFRDRDEEYRDGKFRDDKFRDDKFRDDKFRDDRDEYRSSRFDGGDDDNYPEDFEDGFQDRGRNWDRNGSSRGKFGGRGFNNSNGHNFPGFRGSNSSFGNRDHGDDSTPFRPAGDQSWSGSGGSGDGFRGSRGNFRGRSRPIRSRGFKGDRGGRGGPPRGNGPVRGGRGRNPF